MEQNWASIEHRRHNMCSHRGKSADCKCMILRWAPNPGRPILLRRPSRPFVRSLLLESYYEFRDKQQWEIAPWREGEAAFRAPNYPGKHIKMDCDLQMKWDLILLPRWTNTYETPPRHFAWLNLCLMATRKIIKNLWLFETIVWGRERSYNVWQMYTIWHYDRWNTWGKHAKRGFANLGIIYSSRFTHVHVYAAANWHQI